MPLDVILPKVDMDMATGTISKWHVKDGDAVGKGTLLFEIETGKAAMEIDSPADGTIADISAEEGAVVPVGTTIARIFQAGEPISKLAGPAAAKVALAPAPPTGHILATPLARRLARERGIGLKSIGGSGPRGRIVAADVERAVAPGPAMPETGGPADLYEPGSYDVLAIDGMRRTIAERLTLSKQTIPHFYLSSTCDLTNLLAVRETLNRRAPLGENTVPQWKLSINDFIIKALALALQQVPNANVTWTATGIFRHHHSDVGVAVAVEGGLFTPVVRMAETKSLSRISIEMKDLAARARARKLKPSDYQGGTTAISNLGMFGIEQFTAIINPPHATILAVGAGVERFIPVNGEPALRTQMTCTLSCDHRAVDGAVGAQLLAAFRAFITEPSLMLA